MELLLVRLVLFMFIEHALINRMSSFVYLQNTSLHWDTNFLSCPKSVSFLYRVSGLEGLHCLRHIDRAILHVIGPSTP